MLGAQTRSHIPTFSASGPSIYYVATWAQRVIIYTCTRYLSSTVFPFLILGLLIKADLEENCELTLIISGYVGGIGEPSLKA